MPLFVAQHTDQPEACAAAVWVAQLRTRVSAGAACYGVAIQAEAVVASSVNRRRPSMYTILYPDINPKLREPRVTTATADRAERAPGSAVLAPATVAPAAEQAACFLEDPVSTAGLAWFARLRQALWPRGSRRSQPSRRSPASGRAQQITRPIRVGMRRP